MYALGGATLRDAVVDFSRARGPVVELGSKVGANANMMGEVPYIGIEESREFVNEGRRRFDGVRSVTFYNESPTDCRSVRDDEAEYLFSVFGVHDYDRASVEGIARECRRILRRGSYGYFFIVNPEVYDSWKGDAALGFFRQLCDSPNKDNSVKLMTGSRRDSK